MPHAFLFVLLNDLPVPVAKFCLDAFAFQSGRRCAHVNLWQPVNTLTLIRTHKNIQTTLQTYVHNTEKMSERSVELFEQIIAVKTS